MARALRIEVPHGVYHVTSRGNAANRIFLDDEDHVTFLEILAGIVARHTVVCHAYCLMPNHSHLILETPRANLAAAMRHLNGVYAQRFNRRHSRSGHVFQGRYHAVLVEKDRHLLELVRYLALNPVRAALCDEPSAWKWSSFSAMVGDSPRPRFLTPDWILLQFARSQPSAEIRVRAFVADADAANPWIGLRGVVLGSESFVRAQTPSVVSPEIPRRQRLPMRPPLGAMLAGGTPASIQVAYSQFGYRLHEIASELGVHVSTVSRRLAKAEQAARMQDTTPGQWRARLQDTTPGRSAASVGQ